MYVFKAFQSLEHILVRTLDLLGIDLDRSAEFLSLGAETTGGGQSEPPRTFSLLHQHLS